MNALLTVFRKECTDAWRDRNAMILLLLSSILVGPLLLSLMSFMVTDIEKRAEKREIMIQGVDSAPTLRNYLERQSHVAIQPHPAYEKALKSGHLHEPVLVIDADFEAVLAAGEQPTVKIMTASGSPQASQLTGKVKAMLEGFNQERVGLKLLAHGVAQAHLSAIDIEPVDVTAPQASSAAMMNFIPMLLLSAVVYGCMASALDSTAGERERSSLEPLLGNPVALYQLVIGKWLAICLVGFSVCSLSSLSFLPGQWLLQSESLAAMFRFSWRECLSLAAILLPLVSAISALMMVIGIRASTHKQAQTNASIFMAGFSLVPLITLMNQQGEQTWQLLPPAIAQFTLMSRVLRQDPIHLIDLLVATGPCLALTGACLWWISRNLRALGSR
jgi:sodium transport system permease protein